MKVVAVIDGVTVSSNREVSVIDGSRVHFTDGSWCDTSLRYFYLATASPLSMGPSAKAAATLSIEDNPVPG